MPIDKQAVSALQIATAKTWIFFGLTAALFLLVSIWGGLPFLTKPAELSSIARLFSALLGVVFAVPCFEFAFRDDKRQSMPQVSIAPNLSKEDFGIVQYHPADREEVDLPAFLSGTYLIQPPDEIELWLCTVDDRRPTKFWPQKSKIAYLPDKTWSCKLEDSWVFRDKAALYCFMLIGKDGRKHVDLYFTLNDKLQRANLGWGCSINSLLSDMVRCTDVRELRWSGRKAAPHP